MCHLLKINGNNCLDKQPNVIIVTQLLKFYVTAHTNPLHNIMLHSISPPSGCKHASHMTFYITGMQHHTKREGELKSCDYTVNSIYPVITHHITYHMICTWRSLARFLWRPLKIDQWAAPSVMATAGNEKAQWNASSESTILDWLTIDK